MQLDIDNEPTLSQLISAHSGPVQTDNRLTESDACHCANCTSGLNCMLINVHKSLKL